MFWLALNHCSNFDSNCHKTDVTCNPTLMLLLGNNLSKRPVWLAVGTNLVMYSHDNGLSWQLANNISTGFFRSVASNHNKRWLIPEFGAPVKFHYSDDDGINWKQANNSGGLSGTVNAIHHSNGVWWAGDTSGYLANSNDGLDWNFVKSFPGKVVEAIDSYNGTIMIVGNSGFNTFSSDQINWTINTDASGDDLLGICFNADGRLVATGNNDPPAVYVSNNFGVSWQNGVDLGLSLFEITLSGNTFLTSGGNDVYSSTDGNNFKIRATGSIQGLQSIDSIDSTVMAAGTNGEIRRSMDSGLTWSQISTPKTTSIVRIRGATTYYQKPFWE